MHSNDFKTGKSATEMRERIVEYDDDHLLNHWLFLTEVLFLLIDQTAMMNNTKFN